jgi:hypothetical protein
MVYETYSTISTTQTRSTRSFGRGEWEMRFPFLYVTEKIRVRHAYPDEPWFVPEVQIFRVDRLARDPVDHVAHDLDPTWLALTVKRLAGVDNKWNKVTKVTVHDDKCLMRVECIPVWKESVAVIVENLVDGHGRPVGAVNVTNGVPTK